MQTLWRDLRYGARVLLKKPGFTFIAVITLALGIGANTAIFSLVNTALLRPLPVDQPEQLVSLNNVSLNGEQNFPTLSYPNYRDLRDRNDLLAGLIAYRMTAVSLSNSGVNERLWGYLATGNYFEVLGVKPALGRFFTPADDEAPGAHPVAVITYACWQKRFAGEPRCHWQGRHRQRAQLYHHRRRAAGLLRLRNRVSPGDLVSDDDAGADRAGQ